MRPEELPMLASDIMTSGAVTVHPETSVRHVAAIMLKHRISGVPVVNDLGGLVGIVTEGDLLRRAELGAGPARRSAHPGRVDPDDYLKLHGRLAQDVMMLQVWTVSPEDPVSRVAALLAEKGIKRVPVMEDCRIVGIVSRADLLKIVADPAEDRSGPGDASVHLAIVTRLREDVGFPESEIEASVANGIVSLCGRVRSTAERRAVCAAVWSVRGVRGLIEKLQIADDAASHPAAPPATISTGRWTDE